MQRSAKVGVALLLTMALLVGWLRGADRPVAGHAFPTATSASRKPASPPTPLGVPWAALPAPPVSSSPVRVAPCSASQLQVHYIRGQGATGHAAAGVEVANREPAHCFLEGRPVVELRDAGGRPLARSGDRSPFICSGCGGNHSEGPFLVPGGSALPAAAEQAAAEGEPGFDPGFPGFSLAQGYCPGGVFPPGAELVFVLPGGLSDVPVDYAQLPLPFDYRCDNDPSSYPPPGRPELLVGYYDGYPVSFLIDGVPIAAEVVVPARVEAGSALHYQVTLQGPTVDSAVLGCPGYTERLTGLVVEPYRVNCEDLGPWDLSPRRLEMVIHVPADVAPGPVELSWQADPPYQQARATATVVVQ